MIITERLIIQPWSEGKASDFFELSRDEGFTLFPITIYRQESVETAREWIRAALELNRTTTLGKWAVMEKKSSALIGLCGLTPWDFREEKLVDITYRLRQSAWGKGFGLEVARALVDFGFNKQNLDQITATITPDNTASKNVAKKLGMIFDQSFILKEVPTDLYRLYKTN